MAPYFESLFVKDKSSFLCNKVDEMGMHILDGLYCVSIAFCKDETSAFISPGFIVSNFLRSGSSGRQEGLVRTRAPALVTAEHSSVACELLLANPASASTAIAEACTGADFDSAEEAHSASCTYACIVDSHCLKSSIGSKIDL